MLISIPQWLIRKICNTLVYFELYVKIPEYIEPPFRRKLHHLLNDEFVIQI
jgi:hypothetical protein